MVKYAALGLLVLALFSAVLAFPAVEQGKGLIFLNSICEVKAFLVKFFQDL